MNRLRAAKAKNPLFQLRCWALGAAVFMGLGNAQAVVVTGQYSAAANNSWTLQLSLFNDGSLAEIPAFSLYFDRNQFELLSAPTAPQSPAWDALVLQSSTALAQDGVFDAAVLTPGSGVLPQATLSGFSVQFNYLGSGSPGALPFDIYTLNGQGEVVVLESGTMQLQSPVPEPTSAWLAGLGGLVLTLRLMRARRGQA